MRALNYQTHVTEGTGTSGDAPPFFLRVAGASAVIWSRSSTVGVRPVDYEGELAVVIGRRGRHIPIRRGCDVIAGYSCFNDGSVRDWQRHTPQITVGKNFAETGAFGPWLTTSDEVPTSRRQLTTRVNGALRQQAKINEMIFGIPRLISYLSTICDLVPGDVIVTGTPGGVGTRQTPGLPAPGDVIESKWAASGAANPIAREDG